MPRMPSEVEPSMTVGFYFLVYDKTQLGCDVRVIIKKQKVLLDSP